MTSSSTDSVSALATTGDAAAWALIVCGLLAGMVASGLILIIRRREARHDLVDQLTRGWQSLAPRAVQARKNLDLLPATIAGPRLVQEFTALSMRFSQLRDDLDVMGIHGAGSTGIRRAVTILSRMEATIATIDSITGIVTKPGDLRTQELADFKQEIISLGAKAPEGTVTADMRTDLVSLIADCDDLTESDADATEFGERLRSMADRFEALAKTLDAEDYTGTPPPLWDGRFRIWDKP